MTFCDWYRLQRELNCVFNALYAAGRAKLSGADVRVAMWEVVNG